jgi:uncharacterized protein YbjT (DUF2867 family)
MKVLVLGAYGFIGSAITRDLVAAGHEVTGFGRKIGRAARQFPQVAWVARDLRMMRAPEDWRDLVAGMDGIVNAAGVLQDGADDDVAAVQSTAMQALFAACAQYGPRRIVQISAVGADSGASTRFMTTKAEADAALAASALDWIILRPGLVFGPSAYGATALLRALAAFPLIQPLALPGARVQTVALSDVVRATSMALEGHSPTRTRIDLVEDKIHSLEEVILALRAWHGLPPARTILAPDALVWLLARGGDALGRLGWRPPLRTTSVVALAASVTGDASVWRKIAGKPLSDLSATLRGMPSNAQEHWSPGCGLRSRW